jgi:hypothetical protein
VAATLEEIKQEIIGSKDAILGTGASQPPIQDAAA